MKPLNNITNKIETDYMRRMKSLNAAASSKNVNEDWMAEKLDKTWSRQVVKGFRVFDFWNHKLGVAIEVDGNEHDRDYDNYRDEYNFRRSGIVVLRVRNMNESDATKVLLAVSKLTSHKLRREAIGISGNTKAAKRNLSTLDYDKCKLMFVDFLAAIQCKPYWALDK